MNSPQNVLSLYNLRTFSNDIEDGTESEGSLEEFQSCLIYRINDGVNDNNDNGNNNKNIDIDKSDIEANSRTTVINQKVEQSTSFIRNKIQQNSDGSSDENATIDNTVEIKPNNDQQLPLKILFSIPYFSVFIILMNCKSNFTSIL